MSKSKENVPEKIQTTDKMEYLPAANNYDRGNWQTFDTIQISSGVGEEEDNPENVKPIDKQLITCSFEEYLPAKDSD